MLVGERMARPVIAVEPDTPIHDALNLMRTRRIRRMPVVEHGQLVGIVSMKDLLNASPSQATSLSVWELNYLLSKVTVAEIMSRQVLTVQEDTPIEDAARIMADNRIGGLPVLHGSNVVGIITETDLFKTFLELLGARKAGVRAAVLINDAPGQLAKLTQTIAAAGGNIVALGTFVGESPAAMEVTLKISGLDLERVRDLLTPVVQHVMDVRVATP
ncbi:MAG: CBS and ACT domain-containing protein [Chloroflexaceae bacterium]|nr:CBS and ACT domain-containing protein [Chloroflexaceae bacterium]